VICYCIWLILVGVWHSKWRYAVWYSIDPDKVLVEKEPHNCDFLAAPLGAKSCEYEREVSTIEWGLSTAGSPIVSYDEGKSWTPFTPESTDNVPKVPTVEKVVISWKKVEN